jgi:hypothetical protein
MTGKENTNHQKPPASSRLVELGGFEPPTFCLPGISVCDSESAFSAQAKGHQGVGPSVASPDSYNKHRPIQRVSAGHSTPATRNERPAARFSFGTPARKVTHPKLSERAGAVSSSRHASMGKGAASEALVQPISLGVLVTRRPPVSGAQVGRPPIRRR